MKLKKNIKTIIWLHPHLLFWNGGTRYVYEVTKRLAKHYRVVLVVSKSTKKSNQEFKNAGVQVQESNRFCTNDPWYWLTMPYQIKHETKILKDVLSTYPDAALVTSLFPTNVIGFRSGHSFSQICWEPYAYFYDSDLIADLPPTKRMVTKGLSFIYQNLDRKACRNASNLMTLNKSTGEWIKRIYGINPDKYTYMGVDTSHFRPRTHKSLAAKYSGRKIIFHSTDFTELKGTKWTLLAMKLILQKLHPAHLIISSPHNSPVESQKILDFAKSLGIKDKVEILGNIPYKDLPRYYSLADLIMFTGIGDHGAAAAASLSVLEALACETPVVRSNYTDEEVIDGKSGYLVNPKNSRATANAAIKILSNTKLAHKMGKFGRQTVLKYYNWDKTTQIIEKELLDE